MDWGKYNTIDTRGKLRELDKFLMVSNKPKHPFLALDSETSSLSFKLNVVVGISLAVSQDQGFYIPLLQWEPDLTSMRSRTKDKITYPVTYRDGWFRCVWTGEKFLENVKPKEYDLPSRMPLIPKLLKRWTEQAHLLGWNIPFDTNFLIESLGVDITDSIFLDGSLLVHAIDENDTNALKGNIPKYAKQLGIDPAAETAIEKQEMLGSIIINGGDKAGQVWRAAPEPQAKYACADAFLTYGICQAALKEFKAERGDLGMKWFFQDEVMPLCKEVVIPMQRGGMQVDVPHFERLLLDTQNSMKSLEDDLQKIFSEKGLLEGFELGAPEEVSQARLFKKIIELEGLEMPTRIDKITGEVKESLAKAAVKQAYNKNPHWLFGHILGTDELQYSEAKLRRIGTELHYYHLNKEAASVQKPLKRYRFNISSDPHLRWLFVDRLGVEAKSLPSTDASTAANFIASMKAEVLKDQLLPKFPWVSKLLAYKKLAKLESTYVRPICRLHIDGWVYPGIKQNGTGSGRFSMSGINLQTLPRADAELQALAECEKCGATEVKLLESVMIMTDVECLKCGHIRVNVTRPSTIKAGFTAPQGRVIIAADYATLEPRCFAEMSNSDSLKAVYSKGLDLYSHVYCLMFDSKNQYSAHPDNPNYLKRVNKALRNSVKVLTLGIPYGSGNGQVAIMIGATITILDEATQLPVVIPDMTEGKRIRDLYLDTFPELRAYMEKCHLQAVTRGYVETIIGRRRHLPKAFEIQKVLQEHGLSYADLEGCSPRTLKKASCTPTSKATGVRMRLTSEMLKQIQAALGLHWEKIKKKENWAYIRGLLKSDLNLSCNHPIQGLAAHIVNRAAIETARELKVQNLKASIKLNVHDELILYGEESLAIVTLLQKCMEDNFYTRKISVAMIAEPVMAANLKGAK